MLPTEEHLLLSPVTSPTPLHLLRWLFLQPMAWCRQIAQIDPTLSPLFCLTELTADHWRQPQVRRLLWTGYVFWPTLLALFLTIWMTITREFVPLAFAGIGLAWGMGLLLSLTLGVAVGIAAGISGGIYLGIVWSSADHAFVDMMFGNDFGLFLGINSAIVLHLVHILSPQLSSTGQPNGRSHGRSHGKASKTFSGQPQPQRRAHGVTVGTVVGIAIFGLAVGGIINMIQARQANMLADAGPGLILSTLPALLLGSAAALRARSWLRGIAAAGICFGMLILLFWNIGSEFGREPSSPVLLLIFTITIVLVYLIFVTLPFGVVQRFLGAEAGAIAGTVSGVAIHVAINFVIDFYALWPNLIIGLIFVGLGLTMHRWRPLITYPIQVLAGELLYRWAMPRANKNLLHHHAAFQDELQYLPLIGLDRFLVFVAEMDADQGQTAIDYLSTSRQQWAAQAAQIELDARHLARCTSVETIATAHETLAAGLLAGPASALLRTFHKLSEDAAAALAQRSRFNQRLVLTGLEHDLNGLLRELTRSSERYATRFRPIATSWRDTIAAAVAALDNAMTTLQEIPNPYVVGVPLSRHQEIFVGRTDISRRIEGLLREQDHPPILLYGQRRMGKTSLLYQLRWMLPQRILPIVVDLQGPVALSTNHAGFLYNLAKGIQQSAAQQALAIERLPRSALADDPFTVFDDWLDELEQALLAQNRNTLLLALDEFEALNISIQKGRLDEDAVLGTLRHIIQHRPRFKLLLAGSHLLGEFQRWSSYLINAQTLHLSYLQPHEAHQLIEHPVTDFTLRYTPDAGRHVLALTRGHPYLIQLLCAELVLWKNAQAPTIRYQATVADVEAVIPEIMVRGQEFFADIELNQLTQRERTLLHQLARAAVPWPKESVQAHQTVLNGLIVRELLEHLDGGYQFQVPLIHRWFAHAKQNP